MSQRVYVGMSGGVDSSVTAALLVEQGYDVTGVYMKNWSQDLPGMRCPWAEDLADAKRVAVGLGIDFKVFDFEREYRDRVVQYMIDEYKLGRTPNPDIMCNQEVKFRLFLDAALADGADMIATGHYAGVSQSPLPSSLIPAELPRRSLDAGPVDESAPSFEMPLALSKVGAAPLAATRLTSPEGLDCHSGHDPESSSGHGAGTLKMAKDASKDQTYFLYRVTAEALGRTLFPLGGLLKSEVRELAKSRNLWTASKKESMGVCFVGNVGMREFLSQYVEAQPGDIIEKGSGARLGRHDGAIFYTLGQRHGLELGGGLPYYVVGKDMTKNEVYVSRNLQDSELVRDFVTLEHLHWIAGAPEPDARLQARIRHRGNLIDATLDGNTVTLAASERAITPGQSIVLYSGDTCLGGGIVAS